MRKKLAVSFAVGAILCAIVACARWRLGAFFSLCDGAFVASVALLCAGVFSVIGKSGAFSAISFGMKTLAARFRRDAPASENHSVKRDAFAGESRSASDSSQKPQTYFDYVREKRDKPRAVNATWTYFATGGIFLALAILFLLIADNKC